MRDPNKVFPILMLSIFLLVAAGCADKNAGSDETAAEANPYAAWAGDWMAEAYAGESTEPAAVVLLKATDDPTNWSFKFVHLDDPVMAKSVSMVGDTLVMVMEPYASAIRDDETVDVLTSYMKMDGNKLSGRAHASYSSGDQVDFRLMAEKVQ